MSAPKPQPPAEPGSPESLGLNKEPPETPEQETREIEEKGEPFGDNFA